MAHIHELIDFVVSAYIVHKDKVLMIYHGILDEWLPIGGHIELDEDSDEALFREIKEESGLSEKQLKFIDNKPRMTAKGTKFLLTPQYVDIHDFHAKPGHKHLVLIYFVKSKTQNVKLKEDEHRAIKWFTLRDLDRTKMRPAVRFYAKQALKVLGKK